MAAAQAQAANGVKTQPLLVLLRASDEKVVQDLLNDCFERDTVRRF